MKQRSTSSGLGQAMGGVIREGFLAELISKLSSKEQEFVVVK